MDTREIAVALRAEIARLQQALALIEGVSTVKRRGRPPKNPEGVVAIPTVQRRKPFSAETKRKMAAAQKARWAAKNKAAAKG
jgi:hypothetical protein